MVAQHVVDAGEVAGILLEALRVVEAGRVDDAFKGGREKRLLVIFISQKRSFSFTENQ